MPPLDKPLCVRINVKEIIFAIKGPRSARFVRLNPEISPLGQTCLPPAVPSVAPRSGRNAREPPATAWKAPGPGRDQ
jgi:hypothetical protein